MLATAYLCSGTPATAYLGNAKPSCLTEGITCTMAGNVLGTVAGVLEKEECNTLCVTNGECHFFNWYGPTGLPFKNICFLLDSCSSTSSCTGCVSGGEDICALQSSECSIRGSCNVEEDNLITLEPGVQKEADCKQLCASEDRCKFYNYFDFSNPLLPYQCMLLSACSTLTPERLCHGCVSGSDRECAAVEEERPVCKKGEAFFDNGEDVLESKAVITKTATVQVKTMGCIASSPVLMVGGGGGGGKGNGYSW